jgi:hypothetical protein
MCVIENIVFAQNFASFMQYGYILRGRYDYGLMTLWNLLTILLYLFSYCTI